MNLYQSDIDKLNKIALSKEDIKECKKQGLLPSNYDILSCEPDPLVYSKIEQNKDIYMFADLGTGYGKYKGGNIDHVHVYALSDFIIINVVEWHYYFDNLLKTEFLPGKTPAIVIPLREIKKFNYKDKEREIYVAPTYGTKAGSPVKGAIIGGAIAGSTGAIVGAIASSKSKTVARTPGGAFIKTDRLFDLVFSNGARLKEEADLEKMHYIEHNGGLDSAINNATDFSLRDKLAQKCYEKGYDKRIPIFDTEATFVKHYYKAYEQFGSIDPKIDKHINEMHNILKAVEKIKKNKAKIEDQIKTLQEQKKGLGVFELGKKKEIKGRLEELYSQIRDEDEKLNETKDGKTVRLQDIY